MQRGPTTPPPAPPCTVYWGVIEGQPRPHRKWRVILGLDGKFMLEFVHNGRAYKLGLFDTHEDATRTADVLTIKEAVDAGQDVRELRLQYPLHRYGVDNATADEIRSVPFDQVVHDLQSCCVEQLVPGSTVKYVDTSECTEAGGEGKLGSQGATTAAGQQQQQQQQEGEEGEDEAQQQRQQQASRGLPPNAAEDITGGQGYDGQARLSGKWKITRVKLDDGDESFRVLFRHNSSSYELGPFCMWPEARRVVDILTIKEAVDAGQGLTELELWAPLDRYTLDDAALMHEMRSTSFDQVVHDLQGCAVKEQDRAPNGSNCSVTNQATLTGVSWMKPVLFP